MPNFKRAIEHGETYKKNGYLTVEAQKKFLKLNALCWLDSYGKPTYSVYVDGQVAVFENEYAFSRRDFAKVTEVSTKAQLL